MGNAYSDEILHAARLSPIALTHKLKPEEWERLFAATRSTLISMDRPRSSPRPRQNSLRASPHFVLRWPFTAVSASPARAASAPIQRIRYADNETNYCAACQTGGKVLADRSLSRLLGSDWPRTLDELEALKRR